MKLPSPFTPLFGSRFSWYYRQRYWVRFGITFGIGWLGALLVAQVWALAVGEIKEALLFYTPEGAVLIIIFLAVFMLEGAIIGAIVDVAAYLRRRK